VNQSHVIQFQWLRTFGCLLSVLICCANISYSQGFYGYAGGLISTFNHSPFVWNNPGQIGQFSAIPVDRSQVEPIPFRHRNKRREFSLGCGYYNSLKNQARVAFEFNYLKLSNEGDLRRLRFTDMIDEDRGFVSASRYANGNIVYSYNSLAVQSLYCFVQDLHRLKTEHSLGIGLRLNFVYGSSYYITSNDVWGQGSGDEYFMFNDLTMSDKGFSITPFMQYKIKVFQHGRSSFWPRIEYYHRIGLAPLEQKSLYEPKPSASVLLFGFEWQRGLANSRTD